MYEPVALPLRRSPRQTLHHLWAPKLRRIVMLTGLSQLRLWVMLEAHPGVTRYCERPILANGTDGADGIKGKAGADGMDASPFADFWAARDAVPVWLRLVDSTEQPASPLAALPTDIELISDNELERHRVWIRNWLSLLPYLSTTTPPGLPALQIQVVKAVGEGATFDEIERGFPGTDPVLTRTALIAALHQGLLVSDDLQHRPWDRLTHLRATLGRDCRAPQ